MTEEKARFQRELEAFASAAAKVTRRIGISSRKIDPTIFIDELSYENVMSEAKEKVQNTKNSSQETVKITKQNPAEIVKAVLHDIGIQAGEKIHYSKFSLIEERLELPGKIRRIKYNKQTEQYTILLK